MKQCRDAVLGGELVQSPELMDAPVSRSRVGIPTTDALENSNCILLYWYSTLGEEEVETIEISLAKSLGSGYRTICITWKDGGVRLWSYNDHNRQLPEMTVQENYMAAEILQYVQETQTRILRNKRPAQ